MTDEVFQSTPPARGATWFKFHVYNKQHFNPRPPRGGRRMLIAAFQMMADISIHAPREGGDLYVWHKHSQK